MGINEDTSLNSKPLNNVSLSLHRQFEFYHQFLLVCFSIIIHIAYSHRGSNAANHVYSGNLYLKNLEIIFIEFIKISRSKIQLHIISPTLDCSNHWPPPPHYKSFMGQRHNKDKKVKQRVFRIIF